MLARAREFLTRKQTDSPRLEAEILVADALGLDRLQLFLQFDRPVSADEVAKARERLVRRGKHEPVAYITGRREFYGRTFAVSRAVLTPRPETELLVDLARERRKSGATISRVLDVGVGSGCLSITLFHELGAPQVVGVDVSAEALVVARANAAHLGAQVEFVEGDGPESLVGAAPFDLLVSNPPYIDPRDAAGLAPDVRDWEPALALFTPPGDNLHWLRRLLDCVPQRVTQSGIALIELGQGQSDAALELAGQRGLEARTHRDYGGIERVLEVQRRG